MFGHQDDDGSAQPDPAYVADQADSGALSEDNNQNQAMAAPAQTVQPSAPPVPSAPPPLTPVTPAATPAPAEADDSEEMPDTNDLIDIKTQALTQLTPLIGHLDQSPEEKFRTTMMMIQASDNQSLIKTAYAAAQNISDEKVRAQALLDVVNEINYFTQGHSEDQS